MNINKFFDIKHDEVGEAKRRLVWPRDDMRILTIPKLPINNARGILLAWIGEHTSGKFYLGGNKVAFMDEKDEIMFKLGFKNDY